MCTFTIPHRAMWVGVFAAALALVVACDMPTTGPSLETETGLNTPVVVDKTFSFLGGEKSQHEPLIDTTTSQFDSLFTVGASDPSISIEEEVSSFDIGSLEEAIDGVTEGVGIDTSLTETVIEGSDLASQYVDANYQEKNGVPPPTPSEETTVPVGQDTIPFPPGLLAIPTFDGTEIDADTLKKATLTEETSYKGTTVNLITFTLFNDATNATTLTDGNGNPPAIKVRDEAGDVVAQNSFGATIGPGQSETTEVGIEGETLGEDSELVLVIDGNDPKDQLTIELSPLRYQEVTLGGVDQVAVTASKTNISTQGGSGGTQFAGLEMRSGTLQLEVANNLSFPVAIDTLLLENNLQGSPLPDSFPTFKVFRDADPIAAGATKTFDIDLEGRGIASGIDVTMKGASAQSGNTLTIAADGNVNVSASGSLPIEALYFWPNGEQIHADGIFEIQQERISFDQPEDFVELSAGTLALDNFVSEPTVAFESFRLSFPDIRSAPYGKGDSLSIEFPVGAESNPEVDDVDLSDLRLSPTGNVVDVHLRGLLETIAPSNRTASTLRVVRFEDEIRTDVSVENLDVRAVEAGVNPFSIDVTEDANDDGNLDLSDPAEITQASFGGFEGVAENVDGLEVTGSELKFHIKTDVGTDAQLFAALQGRDGSSRTFLAGRGSKKSVPSTSSMADDFYVGSTPIANENLIQFGVEGAQRDDPVTRSIVLTEDNSTVDHFISTLPTSLRVIARARLTGDDEGRIRLRRPLTFDAGLSVSVPVKVNGAFSVEDTIDADFSALEDVTDPNKDVTVSTAELRVIYSNGIPLGTDAQFVALNNSGDEVVSLPGEDEAVRLKPAPKAEDGTASGTRTGTATLDLSAQELRDLAKGRQLRLRLAMDQATEGGPATLRATDTIELSLEAKVEASVRVSN